MSQSRAATTATFCLECNSVMACVTAAPAYSQHSEIRYECQSCGHGFNVVEAPAKLRALVSALLKRQQVAPPPTNAASGAAFQ
jgi:transposase-like protein